MQKKKFKSWQKNIWVTEENPSKTKSKKCTKTYDSSSLKKCKNSQSWKPSWVKFMNRNQAEPQEIIRDPIMSKWC